MGEFWTPILLGVTFFTVIVLALVAMILVARKQLVSAGSVKIVVNEQKTLSVPAGGKLLGALADNGIFVSSACGGGGTCAQCKVKVLSGGGTSCRPRRRTSTREPRRKVCDCPARLL